jgi:hypothetical protein
MGNQITSDGNNDNLTLDLNNPTHIKNQRREFSSKLDILLEKEQSNSSFHFDMSQITEFQNECKNIKRDYNKFDIVLDKFIKSGNNRICFIETFNTYIGFSIPSADIISIIYDTYTNHQRIYPNAKLVDLGTGSSSIPGWDRDESLRAWEYIHGY